MNPFSKNELPTILHTKVLSEHCRRQIQEDELLLPSNEKYLYTSFTSHPQAVMVIAETIDKKWVINFEYRCPTRQVLLSLPGGCVDPGEEPLIAAKRELLEETGYSASVWVALGSAYPFPGQHNQQTFYFYATNAKKSAEPKRELCEIIQTTELDLSQIHEHISKGQPLDGHVPVALYLKGLKNLS